MTVANQDAPSNGAPADGLRVGVGEGVPTTVGVVVAVEVADEEGNGVGVDDGLDDGLAVEGTEGVGDTAADAAGEGVAVKVGITI